MSGDLNKVSYAKAILHGFTYLLETYPEVFVLGQGLWSPWYVGETMTDLDKKFGQARVLDSPVSELACTGAGVGASLCGYRPIIVHPRMDFMLYAMDPIINQAAKWSHMLGGQANPAVTIRGIINRGGEQGAQHSQALHAWFAHVPGLRVVMPATVADARDLLIASVLCDDPVLYIDDRWLYELEDELPPIQEISLEEQGSVVRRVGSDITLAGAGYSLEQCMLAAEAVEKEGISCEVVDLRVLNPIDCTAVNDSVLKTGHLCAVDGGWKNCGLAGEVLANVVENVEPRFMKSTPVRLTLPDAPAPTSRPLEEAYYTNVDEIVSVVKSKIASKKVSHEEIC